MKNIEQLKEQFYALVAPSLPNEWDVEDALQGLTEEHCQQLDEIFEQIPAIWAVSHSLCFAYLSCAGKAVSCLSEEELSLWVHSLLDKYETGGLRAAQLFMEDVEQQFIQHLRGQGGLKLADIRGKLQPYVNGLAGRELLLLPAASVSTDSESIFLPGEIGYFSEQQDNFLLYKFMVSFQWACLAAGTFAAPIGQKLHRKAAHPLDCFFSEFSSAETARCLYHFFETGRILSFLRSELPGLMRQMDHLLPQLPLSSDEKEQRNVLDVLQQVLLRDQGKVPVSSQEEAQARRFLQDCYQHSQNNQVSIEAVRTLYPLLDQDEDLTTTAPLVFQGVLRLQEMRNLSLKKQADKELLLMQAARIQSVHLTSGPTQEVEEGRPEAGQQGQDMALLMEQRGNENTAKTLPEQSAQIEAPAAEIPHPPSSSREQETQLMPQTVVSTEGIAGGEYSLADPHGAATSGVPSFTEPLVYDEWDYRRKGYRKNWCVLTEKVIEPVHSSFIEHTLKKYRGHIVRLRRQFELLRTGERFMRRQREGTDIDLDALVESLSDIHAGLPPSDRLFIRLARDQRDIAVHFLVDMSNSTAGWVGQSIKEALVLFCESMEVLNDRYGIYGFSGMRRLRCEIFPVKRLEERYTNTVRQRIGAIGPREYTRMGPAIRHLTSLFSGVEAKIRLLIILSDGKPEDYDDYKGEYAIEDTRHALLEAKAQGIHPFCITIDRKAHEYMAHMYGEVNYIFVDAVERLPARMSEIYRTLTA